METEKENAPPPIEAVPVEYSITVEEAAFLFAKAGVARSPRTVIRYCATGVLDAKKSDRLENDKYLIALPSIEQQIEKLHAANGGAPLDEPRLDTSRHVATDGATTRSRSGKEDAADVDELNRTKSELQNALIAGQVKDQVIEYLKTQNAELIESGNQKSHLIGHLEARLQLAPPKEQAPSGEGDEPAPQAGLGT